MKKLSLAFFLAVVGFSVQASYLYWQVSEEDASGYEGVNMFNLYATNDGVNSRLVDSNDTFGQVVGADVSAYSGGNYSFYVELANYDGSSSPATETVVARSGMTPYTSLESFITTELSEVAKVQAYHATSYAAAPEPTSGFLMMVGLALLGLKRRKA